MTSRLHALSDIAARPPQRVEDATNYQAERHGEAQHGGHFPSEYKVPNEDLRPDENQDERERVFEVVEAMHCCCQRKKERAQANDREDVGGVDDERFLRNGVMRWAIEADDPFADELPQIAAFPAQLRENGPEVQLASGVVGRSSAAAFKKERGFAVSSASSS